MSKINFYSYYNRPPKVNFVPDLETCFVSQSEVETAGLKYQLHRFGMDSVLQRMEDMRSKFGYADCTKISSFVQAQNDYVKGREYFEALPSEIRRKYNDLPENFYEDIAKNPDTAYENGFISEEYYKAVKANVPNDKIVVDTSNIKKDSHSNASTAESSPESLD